MFCLDRHQPTAFVLRSQRKLLTTLIVAAMCGPSLRAEEAAPAENMCVTCHGTSDLWEGETQHLFVGAEHLANDIHWQKGVLCQDCHGGNAATMELREAHATEDGFRKIASPLDIPQFCGHCHSDAAYMGKHDPAASLRQDTEFSNSAHGRFSKANSDDKRAMTCLTCHPKHAMRPATDPAAITHPSHVFEACGRCHQKDLDEYQQSVHGRGLEHSGLLTSAVCWSCHDAHAILPPEDPASSLHATRVAGTCAQCHRFIEERLRESVHGQGMGPGGASSKLAPGGTVARKPSCTDCHVGHDLQDPRSLTSRNVQPSRCGKCHQELTNRYAQSMHGELTELGYGPGAKCSDCHGAHDILPVNDPNSRMALPVNRLKTCQSCHPGAVANLMSFDPHADHRDRARSPILFWIYTGLLVFISTLFGVFGIHSILWFARNFVQYAKHGRPRQLSASQPAYMRFRPFDRVAHAVMMVSFLGLALTGLPLKFSQYVWAQRLAFFLGGFASTGLWHRLFSITTFGCFFVYAVLLLRGYWRGRRRGVPRRTAIFGPDSPLPNIRDYSDFTGMVRWFLGRGPRPTFERWAYWEKFDFWGACSDIILIGTTGLILWFPNFFCLFLPGEAINVAKVIHSTLALLATGFVFAIHFFSTHFRPDKFPMDMSILTGMVSVEDMEHERPEFLERMLCEGRLADITAQAPSRGTMWTAWTLGMIALLIGLALLAGILFAAFA